MSTDTSYYAIVVGSATFFLFFYHYISPAVSWQLIPSYRVLSKSKKIDFDTRLGSNVHALLTSALCLYALLYDDSVNKDPVWGESFLVRANCAFVAGYMVHDTILMLKYPKVLGEAFMFFHHCATLYAYFFVMTYGVLPWFANFRLLAEMSTPFVNNRWCLDALGVPRSSKAFVANGLAMAAVFFLVRVAVIPPYWYKVYSIYGTEAMIRLGKIWYVLLTSCIVLDTINVFWFFKILRGARKVLKNQTEEKNRNVGVKGS